MADVLRANEAARLRLIRNGVVVYDQSYSPTEEAYTEHAGDRFVLATNSGVQQVNLGGISTATRVMIETDRVINVGIDSQTYLIPISKAFMLVGSFSALYVQNESTTNVATIEFLATD
jgi:hypothetical protein